MIDAIKGLLGSKTFWLAIIGSGCMTGLSLLLPHLGLSATMIATIINFTGAFFGIKGLQQASADFGKNA